MTRLGTATVLRGDARALPLPDASVDLIVTSPPYWNLRSYTDGGEHYAGQIGSEATPAEYIDSLIDCTREWMRVLKPTGSLWVNLGDKYAQNVERSRNGNGSTALDGGIPLRTGPVYSGRRDNGVRTKSLLGLPWRYALRCIDDLGLILRAEVIWSKPNGLPESVRDRVRRSHETWFHLVKQPRYFSAVDEIRTPHLYPNDTRHLRGGRRSVNPDGSPGGGNTSTCNPLGALPGSVWEIPTQPLTVPDHLGVDHFACVDTETEILTRRGWLRHNEVKAGDECAGYDLDAGTARWTQVHAVHSYDYDGELIAVDKRDLSMRLTPNHRTIAQRARGVHKYRGPVEVVRADELTPYHFIPRSAEWEEPAAAKSIGVDLAALCGWIAAEGWYQQPGNVYVCQSPDANPDHVNTIRGLLTRLASTYHPVTIRGVSPSRNKWRARIQENGQRVNLGSFGTRKEAESAWLTWRNERNLDGIRETIKVRDWRGRPASLVTWRLPRGLADEVRRLMPDKRLTWDLANLPADEASALLNAFIDGDGHRRPDGRIAIFQHLDNKVTIDALQAIAVRLGYKTSLQDSGGRWVLYLTTGGRSITLRGPNGVNTPVGREHYQGIVWCPTTGTGTFIARRRGQVFITGNSFPLAWPRQLILGWSPSGICTACGEGRRPITSRCLTTNRGGTQSQRLMGTPISGGEGRQTLGWERSISITGEACACTPYTDHPGTGERHRNSTGPAGNHRARDGDGPASRPSDLDLAPRVGRWREYHLNAWTPPPIRPAVIVDPFGGTGTVALLAKSLGQHGITVDRSADYCRLARWRTADPGQLAAAMKVSKPPPVAVGQLDLFATDGAA